MHITIENRNTMTVYGIRHCGPYQHIDKAFRALTDWAQAKALMDNVTCTLAIFLDNPNTTAAAQRRSEACFQFDRLLDDPLLAEIVRPITILGGCYASYRHIGPYANLAPVYDRFYHHWLPSSEYVKTAQPTFEIYRNCPDNTPEEELITEVYFPVMVR